ncbi:polymer-forming cytoskeletal protein [Trinickia fusca]|uniref:Polymer-forming cytoskeletal protein n=1 Tax=Trinickia fusca TaxID=2419777 RepID=A0A494X8A4_9BURK|nr:polymer-forming cytoskeletal protein [Trinickia fusca]
MLLAFTNLACAAEHAGRGFIRDIGNDHFATGNSVEIEQPVAGDAMAAGTAVIVSSNVAGDVVLTGRDLLIDGDAGQNLYAAGSEVVVNGAVGRNARLAGGRIDIGRRAHIAGNVSVAGGRINVIGDVKGYVEAAGGRIYIDGTVGGDVEASGREVALGPNARVTGALRYRSPNPIEQDPRAVVSGGIERLTAQRLHAPARAMHRVGRWIWTIGLMLLAALLVATMPGVSLRVSETLSQRFLLSLLLAFVVIVCAPVAAIVLLVTGIGAPLGILVVLAYPALMLIGYVSAGIALGDAIVRRVRPTDAALKRRRTAYAALAVLALSLVRWIPWIGGVITVLALLAGVGAFVLQGWAAASGRKAAETA